MSARMLGPEEGGWGGGPTSMGESDDVGPKVKWIVRSHISWGGERSSYYKAVETSP